MISLFGCLIFSIVIYLTAIGLALTFRCSAGHVLLPSICLHGIICSILAAFGYASFSVPAVIAVTVILLALGIVLKVAEKDFESVRKCGSLELLFFAVFTVIFIALNFNRKVYGNDEFSHWALVVKNMFEHNALPVYGGIDSMYPHYPPLASAICYLASAFGGKFSEPALYFGLDITMVSCFFPVFTLIKSKKANLLFPLSAGLLIFGTLTFRFSAFATLGPDTLLGLMAAYIIAEIYIGNSKKSLIFAAIVSFALALVKSIGAVFAIFCGIIFILDGFYHLTSVRRHKHRKHKEEKSVSVRKLRYFIYGAGVIIPAVLSNTLWNLLCKITGAAEAARGSMTQTLVSILNNGFSEFQINVLRSFINAWKNEMLSLGFPLIVAVLLLLLTSVLLGIAAKKEKSSRFTFKRMIYLNVAVVLDLVAYSLGILVSYWSSFTETEALAVASFSRYYSSFLTFWLIVLIIFCICALLPKCYDKNEKFINFIMVYGGFAFFVGIIGFMFAIYPYTGKKSVYQRNSRDPYQNISSVLDAAEVPDNAVVYLAMDEEYNSDTNYKYLAANYDACPRIVVSADEEEDLARAEYIFIDYDTDSEYNETIGKLYGIENPQSGNVYKINK